MGRSPVTPQRRHRSARRAAPPPDLPHAGAALSRRSLFSVFFAFSFDIFADYNLPEAAHRLSRLAAPTGAPGLSSGAGQAEENKARFRRFVSVWENGAVDALPALVSEDYVGHVATGDRDRQGLRDHVLAFRAVMRDPAFSVETQIAEGDLVATRLTVLGTHAETGLAARLMGLNLCRLRDGRIVEEWHAWETLDDTVDLDDLDNEAPASS